MNTWEVTATTFDLGKDAWVTTTVSIDADKVIVSEAGVLMFFEETQAGLVLVRAFNSGDWRECELVG